MLATIRASVAGVVVFGLVMTLTGCQTSGDGTLPGEDRLLEDLMETYVSERFRFYPVESTLSGLPGNDDRLGDFSRGSIDERIHWLTDFHYKLLGLKLTAMSQPAYLDAQWLTSLVKSELYELETRAVWRRSASFYGDAARLGLVALLAEGDLAARADALAGRLEEIPRVFQHARENIVPTDPVWRMDGRASLDACRRLLEDLPKIVEGRLTPHQVAELAGLGREATRAVQDLASALAAAGVERDGFSGGEQPHGFSTGEEELERYFFYRHMIDTSLDNIALEAETKLQRMTHALTELALDRFASQPLASVLAPTMLDGPIETEVVAAESRVLAFVRERDGASPLYASIPVRRVPAYFPGSEVVQLWRPKALEPSRGAFLMVREVARPNATELELLTLREIGGRGRQYAYQEGAASLLRRVVSAPATREGWLARFERGALDEGFHLDSDAIRVEHYRRAILDYTRLLAVIAVHAEGQGLDGAARLFRERAFVSDATARAEAARIAVDLRQADSGLGRLLVDQLAEDYLRAHPLATSSDFEDRLLEDGLLPVRLLRFQLLR